MNRIWKEASCLTAVALRLTVTVSVIALEASALTGLRHPSRIQPGQLTVKKFGQQKAIVFDPKKAAVVIVDMWQQPDPYKAKSDDCTHVDVVMTRLTKRIASFISLARGAHLKIVHAVSGGTDHVGEAANLYETRRVRPLKPLPPDPLCDDDGPRDVEDGQPICAHPFCSDLLGDDKRGSRSYLPPEERAAPSGTHICLQSNTVETPVLHQQLKDNQTDLFTDEKDHGGRRFFAYLKQNNVRTLFYVGAAIDLCVWSRPFGIRRALCRGFDVVVVRDLVEVAPSKDAKQDSVRQQFRQAAIDAIETRPRAYSIAAIGLARHFGKTQPQTSCD